jgi:predicted PurR-regulated permease PerM
LKEAVGAVGNECFRYGVWIARQSGEASRVSKQGRLPALEGVRDAAEEVLKLGRRNGERAAGKGVFGPEASGRVGRHASIAVLSEPLRGIKGMESAEEPATATETIISWLISASAGLGLTVLQFVLSIMVAGVLLANASGGAAVARSLASRLFGSQGPEFQELAGATIRSVVNGIIGVAAIQTVAAGLGFLVVGIPGAGLWTLFFLFAAILQAGTIVLIPAAIYVFAIATTTKAVLFLLWCVVVGVMDNLLKPLLLGRGVAVPIVVIFLGAIGGFLAIGIIGLFIGAVVLSVGYKLFLAWLENPAAAAEGI